MDIIKIAVLGIAGVLIAIPLKRERGEYSTFIAIIVCVCISFYLLTKVETILEFVERVEMLIPVDSKYVRMLIKMVGITYVAEFATNICKDAGYAAIASQIEIFAKLSILVVSVPVLGAFLEMVGNYL
ncbi:MAG: SpoIIIAC/SpoIIIAD family protein [Clostridiales bacterium]|nr:stage III sporulation AC/AD family protein [Roseburia sp.]MDD7638155.1 SpoIIIAC/SpoIIIAD family protein [Clostridiales bacterium]MDY4111290.1 SpoIIIAC/SpoIIIAD family protein [Roseburia sp.]